MATGKCPKCIFMMMLVQLLVILSVKRCLAHDELESKRLDAETTKELEQ